MQSTYDYACEQYWPKYKLLRRILIKDVLDQIFTIIIKRIPVITNVRRNAIAVSINNELRANKMVIINGNISCLNNFNNYTWKFGISRTIILCGYDPIIAVYENKSYEVCDDIAALVAAKCRDIKFSWYVDVII